MGLSLRSTGAGSVSSGEQVPSSVAITVPANKWWQPTSAYLTIVASATVGTRTIQLKRNSAEGVSLVMQSPLTVTAGLTRNMSFYPTAPAGAAYTNTLYGSYPMPSELLCTPGDTILWSDTANIDPTDDRGTLIVCYTQFELFEV